MIRTVLGIDPFNLIDFSKVICFDELLGSMVVLVVCSTVAEGSDELALVKLTTIGVNSSGDGTKVGSIGKSEVSVIG